MDSRRYKSELELLEGSFDKPKGKCQIKATRTVENDFNHQDNEPNRAGLSEKHFLTNKHITTLEYRPDFWYHMTFFSKVKSVLKGTYVDSIAEVKKKTADVLKS